MEQYGPVELMMLHRDSNMLVRLSWDSPLIFDLSWQATLYSMKNPALSGCEWIVMFNETFTPRHTFSDLAKKIYSSSPYLDIHVLQNYSDKWVKNILLEL